LSKRNRGSRYFSWLDILSVKDYATGKTHIKIVQRLTDDDEMDDREWKIITINDYGDVKEEKVSYETRSEHPLNVKLINFSDTSLMSLGYYSDIMQGYPSLIFPVLYPFVTGLFGLIGTLIAFVKMRGKFNT